MKRFRSIFIFGCAITLGAGILLSTAGSINALRLFGTGESAKPTELNLTNELKPNITESNGILGVNDYVTVSYTNASVEEGYHVVLNEGGSLYKQEASYGLTAVTATFEGSLQFECGFEADYETREVVHITALESGTTHYVDGNYWKITATADTKITSIKVNSACNIPSYGEIITANAIVDIQEVTQYADIKMINNKIYLELDLTYDQTQGRIKAEDLTVVGNDAFKDTETFTCDFIETTSATTFKAYFDVSSHHESVMTRASNRQKIVYLHLFVDGVSYSSSGNNVASSSYTTNPLYNKTYSIDGNKSITVGLRNSSDGSTAGSAKLAWLIFGTENVFDFNTNDCDNPSEKNNTANPFSTLNGGSTTCTTYAQEAGLYRYGDTAGKTFKTAIYSNKDTTATLHLNTGGRANKILTYSYVDDYNPWIESLTLNGDTTGVTPNTELSYKFVNNHSLSSWHHNQIIPIADVALEEGYNEIEFEIGYTYFSEENRSYQNQMNIHGLTFKSTDVDTRISLAKAQSYNINESTDHPGNTTTTTEFGDHNPLLPANGGGISGKPTHGSWNFKYESGQLYRYGEIVGYNLKMTLNAEEATVAKLYFDLSGKERHFCPTGNTTSETYPDNQTILDYLEVDGSTEGVTLSDVATDLPAWTSPKVCEVGTITLKKGVNVVTFRFLGPSTNEKVNFMGIDLISNTNITLGE